MRGTIIYDGLDLSMFGVYFDGSREFNKPAKEMERVSIPGRNGDLFIPRNRWANLPLTFNCFINENFHENYAQLSAFLNSRNGYCVLETSWQPEIYRKAAFVASINPSMNQLNRKGQFSIEFDCMPQRFLKSGTVAQEITGGSGTIMNPTAFESAPLLTVYGSGAIGINDETITIRDDAYGEIQLTGAFTLSAGGSKTVNIEDLFNEGDYLTFKNGQINVQIRCNTPVTSASVSFTGALEPETYTLNTVGSFANLSFTVPQSSEALPPSTTYQSVSFTISVDTGIGSGYASGYLQEYIYPTSEEVVVQTDFSQQGGTVILAKTISASMNGITGVSTVGGSWPFMVDLNSLKAYKDTAGGVVSLNHLIDFGIDAPTLKPGANVITSDTYPSTQVDIVPRWWTL